MNYCKGVVFNPACGHLFAKQEKFFFSCPRSRLTRRSLEKCSAVPSRANPLPFLTLSLNLVCSFLKWIRILYDTNSLGRCAVRCGPPVPSWCNSFEFVVNGKNVFFKQTSRWARVSSIWYTLINWCRCTTGSLHFLVYGFPRIVNSTRYSNYFEGYYCYWPSLWRRTLRG